MFAIGIGALAKGITGVGLPILAVPVLASFTSVEEAVVLMVLPSIAANGWLVVTHRKWAVLREHRGFLLFGLAGGVSAPIVAPYFHANGLVRETYAFATASTFLLFSGAQLAAMFRLELLTTERLTIGLMVVVPTLVFTQLGIRWSRSISERAFHNILLTLFVVMELKLVIDVLRSMSL